MNTKISQNVPPPTDNGHATTHPFRELRIGDSLFGKSLPVSYWRMATGYNLISRKVVENGVAGIRVWRIA